MKLSISLSCNKYSSNSVSFRVLNDFDFTASGALPGVSNLLPLIPILADLHLHGIGDCSTIYLWTHPASFAQIPGKYPGVRSTNLGIDHGIFRNTIFQTAIAFSVHERSLYRFSCFAKSLLIISPKIYMAGFGSLAPKTKNLVLAGGLTGFVFSVYFYTMRAVGGSDELQVAIDKYETEKIKHDP
ncbi:hypothetical protein L2E82_27113 [Cichorium intybus]|uniref:Uncharacterized protein n=1 Tax=Cichorium intybus TaxID=13427 RepID=A0ACB9CSG7_CICIN|nr:hypothetical protein L2E82_27113 [Cichorium intybus]